VIKIYDEKMDTRRKATEKELRKKKQKTNYHEEQ
jgi:hypothetical protein